MAFVRRVFQSSGFCAHLPRIASRKFTAGPPPKEKFPLRAFYLSLTGQIAESDDELLKKTVETFEVSRKVGEECEEFLRTKQRVLRLARILNQKDPL